MDLEKLASAISKSVLPILKRIKELRSVGLTHGETMAHIPLRQQHMLRRELRSLRAPTEIVAPEAMQDRAARLGRLAALGPASNKTTVYVDTPAVLGGSGSWLA